MFALIRKLFTHQGATMTAPTDTSNVTGVITPENPTSGDTLTLTISGDDVRTTTEAGSIGPLTANLTTPDGAVLTVTIDAAPFQKVTTTHESVKLTSIEDPDGRVWVVAEDGLTATAVA